jgi:hypothetical protein
MFAAIRRASSFVRSLAAERRRRAHITSQQYCYNL